MSQLIRQLWSSISSPRRKKPGRRRPHLRVENLEHRRLLAAQVQLRHPGISGELFSIAEVLKQNNPLTDASANFRSGVLKSYLVNEKQEIGITITAKDVDAALPALIERGVKGLIGDKERHFLEGYISATDLDSLNSLGGLVMGVLPILRPILNVVSQGDVAMEASRVRNTTPTGYNGTGVEIGVISDSYNVLGTSNLPEVPASVVVLGQQPSTGFDEGRAMIELMYDLAPGASYAFSSGFGGQSQMANAIRSLANAGADIIVDDVYYASAPFFQDGVVAQAVNEVVAAQNITYVSAAGNFGSKSYDSNASYAQSPLAFAVNSDSNPTLNPLQLYDFNPSPSSIDVRQRVTIPFGATFQPVIQWDDPFYTTSGVGTDLRLYLIDSSTNQIVSNLPPDTANLLTQVPFDFFTYTNGSTLNDQFDLVIAWVDGSAPGRLKYIDSGSSVTINEFNTASSTIAGHAAAESTISVAAADYRNQTAVQGYSSKGGTSILFTSSGSLTPEAIRATPTITGLDGTVNSFFGPNIDTNEGFNFFGTSAAAPHVAAVAALVKQANPSLTSLQVKQRLASSAIDMYETGHDSKSGAGLVNAYDAVFGAAVPVSLNVNDGFENSLALSNAWETKTTGAGRIQVTSSGNPSFGTRHLVLDAFEGSSLVDARTEAILHVNAMNHTNVQLTFDQKEFGDSDHLMPATFQGSQDSDGVAISVDGVNWYRVISLTGTSSTNAYQTRTFDLSSLANTYGLVLGADVRIKFQQFGNAAFSAGAGMAFDRVQVTGSRRIVSLGSDVTVSEANGVATFTATLSSANASPISVTYQTTDGTAVFGDYSPLTGILTFAAGETSKSFTVPITNDALYEGSETFTVDLVFAPYGITFGDSQAICTITDNDSPPLVSLSLANTTIAEAGGATTVTATLSAASSFLTTVNFSFAGTAASPADYSRNLTQVVIPAGATSGSITITALQDAIDEANETVIVEIASVINGTEAGTQLVTTTIVDDDAAPNISLSASATNLAEASGQSVVSATLSAVSGLPVTVNLGYTGTATLTADYSRSNTQIVIPAGSISGSATITAVHDTLDEVNETVVVDVTSVINGVEATAQTATLFITDDDAAPNVTLGIDTGSIAEAAGSATITATLSAVSGQAVTIFLAYSGTALLTNDYTRTNTQIVIPAGSTSGTVSVSAVQDLLDEPVESIVVDISSVTNGIEAATQTVSTTIIDDDAPNVTLSIASASIAEASGSTTVTASLSSVHNLPVTVQLGFSGTAVRPGDFTSSNTQIVIPAGFLSSTVTITSVQDTLDEANETIVVDVSGVTNGLELGTQTVTTTIVDDDAAPTVTLSVSSANLAEGAGTALVYATLSAVSGLPVTVYVSYTGTATLTNDYTRSNTIIVIGAGSTLNSNTVIAVQDLLDEANETIIAEITSVTNGTESGTQTSTMSIIDDDAAPTVTLAISSTTLGEANGSATLTATLSAVSGQAVTALLAFSGTAAYPNDYSRATTQIVIPAGSISAQLIITALQDTLDELGETIITEILSVINGVESGNQSVTTTIVDDDAPPTVTLATNASSINETSGQATLTASLNTVSGQTVTILLAFAGSATLSTDYNRSNNQIVIPAGSLSGSVVVSAISDVVDELNETVVVDVSSVTNGTENGNQSITTSIIDDDGPSVALAINNTSIVEAGGTATITASLSTTAIEPVTVHLGYGGAATRGDDFNVAATYILIPAGSLTGTATVIATLDALDEANEMFFVDVVAVSGGYEAGTQRVTTSIIDDDAMPTVTLATSNSTISETNGSLMISATLSTISNQPVTVDLMYTGTAAIGHDYSRGSTKILIPAYALTATTTIDAVQDSTDEPNETIDVAIVAVANATEVGNQSVNVTLVDDDAMPTVSLSIENFIVHEVQIDKAIFVATLSQVSALDVIVELGFSGMAMPGLDYEIAGTQILIPAGATIGQLIVTPRIDNLAEDSETGRIDIIGVVNAVELATQFSYLQIRDHDDPLVISLTIDQVNLRETGGQAVLTATLAQPALGATYVGISLGGTASSADYTLSTPSINIPAGATSASITVTTTSDSVVESNESIIFTANVNNIVSSARTLTATIVDDDTVTGLPPNVNLLVNSSSIRETGAGTLVTATLSSITSQAVTVALGFSGTASSATDYFRSGTQIVIPAGALTGTVTITGLSDAVDEPNETINIDISSVVNGTEAGVQSVTILINDDALPSVSLQSDNSTIAEANGVATITATLSNVSVLPVVIELGFNGSASFIGTDFTASASYIVIPAGELTGRMTIIAAQDIVFDGIETIVVDVLSVIGGVENGMQQTTVTVVDDDAMPTVSIAVSNTTTTEANGTATITATLSNYADDPVIVTLTFSGSATIGHDYAPTTRQIVLALGSTTGTLTINTLQDGIDETNESIVVDVVNVVNALEAGNQSVTAMIVDDDLVPTVTLNISNFIFGEFNGDDAIATATLSSVSAQDVLVQLGFSGVATPGTDYTSNGSQIVIAAGSTTGFLQIFPALDTVDEVIEQGQIDILSVVNGNELGTQAIPFMIKDDDGPNVWLTIDDQDLAEAGGQAIITAMLSAASPVPVAVNLAISGTGSVADYSLSATSIMIPAGALSASITLTTTNDLVDEASETIIVDVNVSNGFELGSQVLAIVITDDDPAPSVTLSSSTLTIVEASGVALITAALSAVSSQAVTVQLDFSGTAGNSLDYVRSNIQIVIAAGSLTGSITLTAMQDILDEVNETVIVQITTVTNGLEAGIQSLSVSILDDDPS